MRLFSHKILVIRGTIPSLQLVNKQFVFSLFGAFSCIATVRCQNVKDTSIDIYFQVNSFQLEASETAKLENFASAYDSIYQVTGYADITGQEKNNVFLSRERAYAVFNVLKSRIKSLNDSIVGYKGGSVDMPATWMNRRVRITAGRNEINVGRKLPKYSADTLGSLYLDYLYFVPDKATLQAQSLDYIQEVAEKLRTYSTGTFEIVGHANYQSKLDSTKLQDIYSLSAKRAKLVYDYLLDYGIPPQRMTYRGVGNSLPRFPHPVNDEERRKNMVVQIIITK